MPSTILKSRSSSLYVVPGTLQRCYSFIGDIDRAFDAAVLDLEVTHVALSDFTDTSERTVSELHAL